MAETKELYACGSVIFVFGDDSNGPLAALENHHFSSEQQVHFAKLFAAAPELLEACKGIVDLLEMVAEANDVPSTSRLKQVKAAIAKARGRL